MKNFWTNIFRYPRFFLSSFIGLSLVILAPFKNLLRLKKFQFFVPLIIILFLLLIESVLKKMTGI